MEPFNDTPPQNQDIPQNSNIEEPAVMPVVQKTSSPKTLILVILGVILLTVVGAGAYYMGMQSTIKLIGIPEFDNVTPYPESIRCIFEAKICPDGSSVSRVGPSCEFEECPNADAANTKTEIDWISQTVEVNRETEISGKEIISLTFQYPSNWKYKTAIKRPNSDYSENDCLDYELLDETNTKRLLIRPICNNWTATYSDRPLDAVVVKQQERVSDSGETTGIVRYFDSLFNEYDYVETDSDKVTDAILIHSNDNDRFLPVYIKVPVNSEENINWKIPDEIVSNLSISIN